MNLDSAYRRRSPNIESLYLVSVAIESLIFHVGPRLLFLRVSAAVRRNTFICRIVLGKKGQIGWLLVILSANDMRGNAIITRPLSVKGKARKAWLGDDPIKRETRQTYSGKGRDAGFSNPYPYCARSLAASA